jgi:hypothetical protein
LRGEVPLDGTERYYIFRVRDASMRLRCDAFKLSLTAESTTVTSSVDTGIEVLKDLVNEIKILIFKVLLF